MSDDSKIRFSSGEGKTPAGRRAGMPEGKTKAAKRPANDNAAPNTDLSFRAVLLITAFAGLGSGVIAGFVIFGL